MADIIERITIQMRGPLFNTCILEITSWEKAKNPSLTNLGTKRTSFRQYYETYTKEC